MSIPAIDRLRLFLRPPGRGLHTLSTGGGYASALLKALYGTDQSSTVQSAWEDSLQRIRRVDSILLGIPSDTGAGIIRGANLGPIGIRTAYLAQYGAYPKGVLDIGDVIVVPQLLHDEMLSLEQIADTRRELYPGRCDALPVSALSIAEAALMAIYELNPTAKIFVLGGDHSVTWPAMLYCRQRCGDQFGVLHLDAHTDLLDQRLGVKYCFATWAYHALKLVKPRHFVQVGIRTSAKPKEHWMHQFPLLQIWAPEVFGNEEAVMAGISEYFNASGVRQIYISNDIDGTDSPSAPATGTPEANGLTPEFVIRLIGRIRSEFELIGGDVVEVAPPLSGSREFAGEKTCRLGARYLHEKISPKE